MDDAQVTSEALSIFRGHRTAGTALCWMWYLLSRHPEVEAAVLAEIDDVLGDREPDRGRLPVSSRCAAGCSTRPSGCSRARGCSRGGRSPTTSSAAIEVPEGSSVVTSSYVIQRDPRFHPEPRRFDPDRFLPERRAGWHPFAYFPFGGGMKTCLGDEFAPFEAVLLLAAIGRTLAAAPRPRPAGPPGAEGDVQAARRDVVRARTALIAGPAAAAGTGRDRARPRGRAGAGTGAAAPHGSASRARSTPRRTRARPAGRSSPAHRRPSSLIGATSSRRNMLVAASPTNRTLPSGHRYESGRSCGRACGRTGQPTGDLELLPAGHLDVDRRGRRPGSTPSPWPA